MILTPEGQYKQAEFSPQCGLYDCTHLATPFPPVCFTDAPLRGHLFPPMPVSATVKIKAPEYLQHIFALVQAPAATQYKNTDQSATKQSYHTNTLMNSSQT